MINLPCEDPPQRNYETSDLFLAAWLLFHGLNLEINPHPWRKNVVVFSSPMTDQLLNLIDLFSNKNGGPIQSYLATVSHLRARIYNLNNQEKVKKG